MLPSPLNKNYVVSRPDVLNDTSIWIQGMGWDQTKWPDSRFPNAVSICFCHAPRDCAQWYLIREFSRKIQS